MSAVGGGGKIVTRAVRGSLAARGTYGLNVVQGWGFGAHFRDGCGVGQFLRPALHTIIIGRQNSFCEIYTWKIVN